MPTLLTAKADKDRANAIFLDICKTFLFHGLQPSDISAIQLHLAFIASVPGTVFTNVRLETFPAEARTRFTIDIDLKQNAPKTPS